jgi:branched-subunit amino acid transport protein
MTLDFLLQLALAAAFGANLFFLARFLAARSRALPRPRALALAGFAVLFAAAFWHYSSRVPVRSGYDNGHDVQYLAARAAPPADCGLLRAGKEASPLFFDFLTDLVSGYSLAAHPVKNRVLLLVSALVFALFLAEAGLSPPAAAAGALLLGFNSLGLLNASSMTTTGANLFYFTCALLAAARFAAAPGPLRGAWAAAALFLLIAARVELFVAPAALAAAGLVFGGNRRAWRLPLNWLPAGVCLLLCSLWIYRLRPYWPGNAGPSGWGLLDLAGHSAWELGAANLSLMFPVAPLLAPALLAGGLLACGLALRRLGGAGLPLTLAGLAAWLAYFSAIFFSGDQYPLHFMRHQLYYFVPAAALAALCLHDVLLLAGKYGRAAAWAAGAALLVYAAAGVRGAAALDGEYRTNDAEWRLLIAAQRALPPGCAVYTGPGDQRRDLLAKYFKTAAPCAEPAPCMVKYVSPADLVFARPAPGARSAWGAPAGEALAAVSLEHRFYTTMAHRETRDPLKLRLGFFKLGEGPEKASVLTELALCRIRGGDFSGAAASAAEAARLAPGSRPALLASAAAEALLGSGAETGRRLRAARAAGAGPDGEASAFFRLAAAGRWCDARAAAERVIASGEGDPDLVVTARRMTGGLNYRIGAEGCGPALPGTKGP